MVVLVQALENTELVSSTGFGAIGDLVLCWWRVSIELILTNRASSYP